MGAVGNGNFGWPVYINVRVYKMELELFFFCIFFLSSAKTMQPIFERGPLPSNLNGNNAPMVITVEETGEMCESVAFILSISIELWRGTSRYTIILGYIGYRDSIGNVIAQWNAISL